MSGNRPVAVLGALMLMPALATPSLAGLEVCNQTNVLRWVSIGYFDGGTNQAWTSEGWWELEPGDCSTTIESDLTQQFYYFRAEDPDETFDGDPEKVFCSVNDAYTIVGNQDCEARGYESLTFLEVDTGPENSTFTLVLNPASVPGAQPIGVEPPPGADGSAGLEVCNQTSVTRWLAVGYLDQEWTSEGWWELAPGDCAVPIKGDLTQQFYYYRAHDQEEEFVGEGYTFCTVDDPFTIVGDQDCEGRGYETMDFREVDTGETGNRYTLTLNADTLPGARPMGAEPPGSTPDDVGQGQIAGADDGMSAATPPADADADAAAAADSSGQSDSDTGAGRSPFGGAAAPPPGDDGDALAATYQAIMGSWRQADDRAMRITFSEDMYARYEVNDLIETGPFEVANTCPGESGMAGGDPVVVVRLPGESRPTCFDVLYVDDGTLEMLTYPDGGLLRFEASEN